MMGARAKTLRKIEQYIFYIFLFSIPFQTRKVLYFEGWRFNEWMSVSVYITDLAIVALFIFWTYDFISKKYQVLSINYYGNNLRALIPNTRYLIFKYDFWLVVFLVISAISIKNSTNVLISWYQWLKLVEFVIFYFYLKNYALRRFNIIQSCWVIITGGVFQAVIGIIQFIKQSSIGLRYFGESLISVDIRGTAYFLNQAGEHVIRAYGTTPHPNVLAGYLLLVLSITYYVLRIRKSRDLVFYLMLSVYALILFAFFLTFSRVIIFAWACAFLIGIILYRKKYWPEVKIIFVTTLVVSCIFAFLYWSEILARLTIPVDDEGLMLRKFYNKESLGGEINLFGVGIGNFVGWLIEKNPNLEYWIYQPVHNIYLLIYSETGLLGILSFLVFLLILIKKTFLNRNSLFIILTSCFMFIGFFDHFFWTLQQGRIIFWGVLTFISINDIIKKQS